MIAGFSDKTIQNAVEIMKVPGTHGSRFGTCTCGRPKVLGVPCAHMVIAVRMGRIPLLNEENIMPYWWTVAQMKLQYPSNLDFMVGMDMSVLKNMGALSLSLYYCPDIAGPRKMGRPKKDKSMVGALETAGRGRGGGAGGGHGSGGRCGGRGGGSGGRGGTSGHGCGGWGDGVS